MSKVDNKKIAIKVIKEEFPGITKQGINALLANIEIETSFTNFVEIPQDYDNVMANSDLKSMQKNLKTLQGGKTEYDTLTNREKLGVLYQGDKNAKFAGGIGGLQLTAANYRGLQNFEQDLNKIAQTLNMSPEDLYNQAITNPEYAIRLSLIHLRDIKGLGVQEINISDGQTLRNTYINPGETQGVATPQQAARDTIFNKYNLQTEAPALEDPSSINEEKKLTTLQQSVIDDLNFKLDEQLKEFPELLGSVDQSRKGIENYVLGLQSENELIKASDLEISGLIDILDKQSRLESEDYSTQKGLLEDVLNDKSNYSAQVIKDAEVALSKIKKFERRNVQRGSSPDGRSVQFGTFITQDDVDSSLSNIFERISKEEYASRPKVEYDDILEELPKSGLPEGLSEYKENQKLVDITEEEEETENIPVYKTPLGQKIKNFFKGDGDGKGLKNALSSVKNSADEAFFALSAGAGIMSVYEATRRDKVTKSHIDPLFKEALLKTREASQIGMPYEQRQAALKDIANSYSGAMKNVMAISGGQRGAALANIGAVDSSRVNALVDLASKSADLRQKNLDLYSKTAAAYSNQKLNADMNNETLRQKVEMNRKNNLRAIGLNLFKEATEFSRNYMDISGIEGSGNQTSIIPGNNVNNEVVNEELSDNIGD